MKNLKELRILVIEDSKVQFETMKYHLVDEIGLQEQNVKCSSSIASLTENFDKQDVLLLDLTLEDSEGIETVKAVRSLCPDTTLIVLTSADDEELPLIALREGAQDYISKKNIDADILKKSMQYALERNRLTRQLNFVNKELEEANRIKNEFLGMAAHDLRNPLGQISGFTSLIYDEIEGKADEETLSMMLLVQERTDFMLSLINDLLDVSEIESGQVKISKTDGDIVSLINRTIDLNSQFARKKSIKILKKFEKGPVNLSFDHLKLEQVFTNLLTNAIKYSHANTNITIGIRDEKDKVFVDVQDEGQGIPEGEIDKIFLPFNLSSIQPTAGESSTGLGLLIVKKIIQAHNGEIYVKSKIGQGSIFYFFIPKN